MKRRGLLLVNLGTPDAPTTVAVRRYLREFLMDPRVIDIPAVPRALLVYGLILPLRPRRSAEAYRSIWTERGSPLLLHGQELAYKLGARLGARWQVELGMRYQSPSIDSALARLRAAKLDDIVVFPLFPQYSSAAWGSAVDKVFSEARKHVDASTLQVVSPYYDHPAFVEALAAVAQRALEGFAPDKILISYHGLPERQVRKADEGGAHCLQDASCCDAIIDTNRNCYRAQCFATSRALAARLGLGADRWEIGFQSRLGRTPWIRPYTDLRLRALAERGARRVAVMCPSFTADCLETLEEIGIRGREDFLAHGGAQLRLVPSLNSTDAWVDAVIRITEDTLRAEPRDSPPSTRG